MTAPAGPRSPRQALVVVPAYQEQAAIAEVVAAVRAAEPGLGLLVVDDGSRDMTGDLARAAGAEVVTVAFNMGVGAAMRVGFLYAARHGYDAVVQVDGDGQHDPSGIRTLIDGLEHADIVVGSRFLGQNLGSTSAWRRSVMRFLAAVVGRLCGTRLTDVTSGFRAAGPRGVSLMAHHYPAEYLGDTIESLVIARRAGLTIAEVPVSMRGRQGGAPSQSLVSASLYLGRALLVLLLAAVRSHPGVSADGAA